MDSAANVKLNREINLLTKMTHTLTRVKVMITLNSCRKIRHAFRPGMMKTKEEVINSRSRQEIFHFTVIVAGYEITRQKLVAHRNTHSKSSSAILNNDATSVSAI